MGVVAIAITLLAALAKERPAFAASQRLGLAERDVAARTDIPTVCEPVRLERAFALVLQELEAVATHVGHQLAQFAWRQCTDRRQRVNPDAKHHLVLDDVAGAGEQ